jgi:hypothetical protein
MSKNHKNVHFSPRLETIPNNDKNPRIGESVSSHNIPIFKTELMDMEGPWGWSNFEIANIKHFLTRLFETQKLSWQELLKQGSHHVQVIDLSSEAQKRLREIERDDWEELYSLRLSGKQRMWGLKEGAIFWMLWWDPHHQVCPSLKKHT